jgi:hypothetical protein
VSRSGRARLLSALASIVAGLALLVGLTFGGGESTVPAQASDVEASPVAAGVSARPSPAGGAPLTVLGARPSATGTPRPAAVAPTLPGGRAGVFEGNRFLVAYYGTAGSGALGVLGETSPDRMQRRLAKAAAPFGGPGRPVQPVYELIVTIADAHPGKDGDYNHDIKRAQVRSYIETAHRQGALVILDLQPGHADFLRVAKRWEWALRDPWVGLALDPEWRMARGGVPGRRIGAVGAGEVNRVSAWLSDMVRRRGLPEKVFMLHQFRRDMIVHPERIVRRPGLAMVQHVDGFGTRSEKLATYHHVARPRQFTMGFKLFYDEDVDRMGARAVLAVRPRVRFVSFQ